ncbi:hypothetical protein [Labrys wisconsinensis]|uniref:DUF1269 domain-containing protein n=1 Tax=Labrys wisconsinensis TaxID=425677 RepID=A0ABU0JM50_9HYPH|nr:hypothetical protein [Labrys wisconsinensis]MDQ0475376.1 hypothetical protein [Labrys wisconsinensis]
MKTTITRFYDRYAGAQRALEDLIENGVPRADISIVANTADDDYLAHAGNSQTAEGAGTGAGIGGVLGGGAGLLAGLGMIAVPGLGQVVAAGWLASLAAGFVAGAAAGAAAGGVIGALMESGLSEERATVYVEGVGKGGALLTVRVDEAFADEVKTTLDAHGPVRPGPDPDEAVPHADARSAPQPRSVEELRDRMSIDQPPLV